MLQFCVVCFVLANADLADDKPNVARETIIRSTISSKGFVSQVDDPHEVKQGIAEPLVRRVTKADTLGAVTSKSTNSNFPPYSPSWIDRDLQCFMGK